MIGRLSWGLIVILLGVSLFFTFQPKKISTNIFDLLPEQQADNIPQQAINNYSEKLSRKHVFLVSAPTTQEAIDQSKSVFEIISNSGLFSEIHYRLSEKDLKAIYTSYEPYRFSMLSKQDRVGLQENPDDWLAEKLIRNIVSPVAGVDSDTLTTDPFTLYRDFLTSLPKGNNKARVQDGYTVFHHQDKSYILINGVLSASAFDHEIQNGFMKLTGELNKFNTPQSEVISFGVIRFALQNRILAEQEISIIGLGSLLGIILIFALVFRRFIVLGVVLLPVLIGILSAFAINLFLFGEMHLVSLVFGASLIGVSIDYTLHYCCSNSNLTYCQNGTEAITKVRSALTIGLISSSFGYLTLAVADFPALRQMAAMAIAGLAGAYFTVIFWLPWFINKPLVVRDAVAKWSLLLTGWLRNHRQLPLWLVLGLIVIVFSVNSIIKRGEDNIKVMQAKIGALDKIDAELKTIIGEFPNSQFYLVKANTAEAVLLEEQKLIARLTELKQESGRVAALSSWVPDSKTQKTNEQLIQSSLNETSALGNKIQAAGLPLDLIRDYQNSLQQTSPAFLSLESFLQSPLGKFQEHLWLGKINGQYHSIVGLFGFTDLARLEEIATGIPSVQFIDRSASVSYLFKKYREIIEQMFPFVLLAILILLSFRFGIKDAMRVVCAPTLSALLSFLSMNLILGEYNLFSIFGLIITVAISIDYAVFIRESIGYNRSTYLAITLAGLTTVLALGLLSLSNTPALSSFGLSLLLGVVFSYLLTPMIVHPKKAEAV